MDTSWLARYPSIAGFLDREGLVELDTEPPGIPGPHVLSLPDLPAWHADVIAKILALRAGNASAISCWLYVHPRDYAFLERQAFFHGLDGLIFRGRVCLYDWTILPDWRCDAGTWWLHWRSDTQEPTQVPVVGHIFRHARLLPFRITEFLDEVTMPDSPSWETCEAHAPTLVCPCGANVLAWKDRA